MLTANLKFINKKSFDFFLSLRCFMVKIEQLTIALLEVNISVHPLLKINTLIKPTRLKRREIQTTVENGLMCIA
jgi:hypothetical protein